METDRRRAGLHREFTQSIGGEKMDRNKKRWVSPSDGVFVYSGRIDREDEEMPMFVQVCSFFRFRTNSRSGVIVISNRHNYYENALGILVDGEYRGKIVLHDGENSVGEKVSQYLLRLEPASIAVLSGELLKKDADARVYDLGLFLDGKMHEITVFKRMDACHCFTFCGLVLEESARLEPGSELPAKRIEIYGDSVSCGEVSEALGRCGLSDPEGHNGIYSNSFYSYGWILARKIGAQLHNVSQGGIALRDGEGYFGGTNALGMLSCFDKIQYEPVFGEIKQWDFSKYTPHVVILAIGQNDACPENYMAEDYGGKKALEWRQDYRSLIGMLRKRYPAARIVLTTTILEHDAAWDRAIDQVQREIGDPKVYHFLYSQNGCGTSGHIRISEAEKMAKELKRFLDSLGEDIWESGNAS